MAMVRRRRTRPPGEQPDQDMLDNLERDGWSQFQVVNGVLVETRVLPTSRRKLTRKAPVKRTRKRTR